MLDVFLVPANSVITSKGDSEPVDVTAAAHPVFLATLSIAKVVEQESIEVTFLTSADGTTWGPKPIAALPQKFYPGEYPLLVDLTQAHGAKFLRAHWDVNRWGRGPVAPSFEVALRLREVPPALLEEARAEAASRR